MKITIVFMIMATIFAQNSDLNDLKNVVKGAVNEKNAEIAAKNASNLQSFKDQIKNLVEASKNQIETDSFFEKNKLTINYSKYCKIRIPEKEKIIPPVELECLKAKEDAASFMKLITDLKGGDKVNLGDVQTQFVKCVLKVKTIRKTSMIYKDCLKDGLGIFKSKHFDELKQKMTEKGYVFEESSGNFVKKSSSGWVNNPATQGSNSNTSNQVAQ